MSNGPDEPRRLELPERSSRQRREASKGPRKPPKLELQLEGRSLPLTSTASPRHAPVKRPDLAFREENGAPAGPPPQLAPPAEPSSLQADVQPPAEPAIPAPAPLPLEDAAGESLEELVPSHMQREFYRPAEEAPSPPAPGEPAASAAPPEEAVHRRFPAWAVGALVGLALLLAGQHFLAPADSVRELPPEPVPLSEIVPSGTATPREVLLPSPPPAGEEPLEGFSEATDPMPELSGPEGTPDPARAATPPPPPPQARTKGVRASPSPAPGSGEPELLEQPPDPVEGAVSDEVIVVEDAEQAPEGAPPEPQAPTVALAQAGPPAPVAQPSPAPPAPLEVLVNVVPENARVVLHNGPLLYEHTGPGQAVLKPQKPGSYTLKVSAPGYEVFQKKLSVEGRHNLVVHLERSPEPVVPPPVYSAPAPSYEPPAYLPPPSSGGGRYDVPPPSY